VSRNKRLILFVPLFLPALLLGALSGLTWREARHERLNQQLIAAIKQEDSAVAMAALAQGADANTRAEKQTLSAWRVLWNRLQGRFPASSEAPTALLLALQWQPDAKGWSFFPDFPRENLPLISALLAHGAQVNRQDALGLSPLSYALLGGKNATSRLLIRHGAQVTQSAGEKDSPLEYAAFSEQVEADTMELLLQQGADPNLTDSSNLTPLCWAVIHRSPDKVRLLLRYHADPNVMRRIRSYMGVSFLTKRATSDSEMRQIARMLKAAGE